ncbi:MAG TPA: hypothetical protein VJ941_00415 [Gracilimonas sp.]|nr:hypothetical protein [Gracilimonas sp.]
MNSKHNNLSQQITYVTLGTIFLLFIPLIAMQFSQEVAWTPADFLIAGTLLFITGSSYVMITQNAKHLAYKVAIGLMLFSILFLIWSNLAVGIIGAEDNPINLWYFGVVLIGISGMLLSRFKPTGLAYTLLTMITGIAVITLTVLLRGIQSESLFEILGINLLFIILFGLAGNLFLYSAKNASQDL